MTIATSVTTVAVASLLVLGAASDASAHRRHARAPAVVPVTPSVDALELDDLAPPAPRATALGTYGDAVIARAHAQRLDREAARDGTAALYPCDPRIAGPVGYTCANPPGRPGYGQYYAYTPSYVSAPQVVGRDPTRQSSLLPPATDLLWVLNGWRIDPH